MLNRLMVSAGVCVLLAACASTPSETTSETPAESSDSVKEVRVTFAGVEYEDLEDVKDCFDVEDFEHCLGVMQDFVAQNPGDALEAAEFIRLNAQHWVAVEFFEVVARSDSRPDDFCENRDLHMALKSGLESPDFREEVIANSQYILGELCWEELHVQMAEDVSGTGAFVDHFCELAREKEGTYEACDENDAQVAEAEAEAEARRAAAAEPREEVIVATDLEWNRDQANLDQVLVFENDLRARVVLIPSTEDGNQVFVAVRGVDGVEETPVGHHRFAHSSRGGQQYRYVTMGEEREFTTVIQDGGRVRLWVPGDSSALDFYRVEIEDDEISEKLSSF